MLLRAEAAGLELVGSDISITIKTDIAADKFVLRQAGAVVLPAKALTEVISRMPEKEIDIDVGDGFQTSIASGKTRLVLVGMDPDQFPKLPIHHGGHMFEFKGDVMKDLIKRSSVAAYKNEDNPILTGIRINQTVNRIRWATCDKNRMAMVSEKVDDVKMEGYRVASGDHFRKIFEIINDKDVVGLSFTDNLMIVSNGINTVFSNLLEGKYPLIETQIRKNETTKIQLLSKELIDALERARITAETNSDKGFIMMIRVDENELILFSKSESGSATDSVALTNFTGEETRVAVNGKYMLDALKAADCEEVQLRFGGRRAPIYISDGDEDDGVFLILPLLVREEVWE